MTAIPAPRGESRAGVLFVLVIAGLAMIGPFAIDTVFPAYDGIGRQFEVSTTAMQQVTSVYLLSFAVMSVFHGPLSDAVGRKPMMIGGLICFAVASVCAALAPNLTVLIACRALQGASAGAATIVSRVVIRDLYSGHEAHRLMSQVMMIFSLAPAVAPVAGGMLLSVGPWPGIFWAVAGYGLLAAAATALVLPETHPAAARQPLRVGPLLVSIWQVGSDPRMVRLALATAFNFAAQFLYVVAAPIIVVDLLGLGEQDFWVLFVPMISGVALGAYLSGWLASRIGRRRIIDIAIAVALASGVLNVTLALVAPRLPFAMIGVFFIATAIAIAFPALQLEALDLFPDRRGAAASVSSFAALAFNAVLAGIIAPLVTGSLLEVAVCSIGFAVVAAALWFWHRRGVSTAGPA